MRKFSQIKVCQRWNGRWAVIREIKGEQPTILAEYDTEDEARKRKRKLQPKKRTHKARGFPFSPYQG